MTLRRHLSSFQFNIFEWSRAELRVCKSQHTLPSDDLECSARSWSGKLPSTIPACICLQRALSYDTIQECSTVVPFMTRAMQSCRLAAVQFHAVRLLPRNIKKYKGRFTHSMPFPCRAHAVPLPYRAAKGLECVFPI